MTTPDVDDFAMLADFTNQRQEQDRHNYKTNVGKANQPPPRPIVSARGVQLEESRSETVTADVAASTTNSTAEIDVDRTKDRILEALRAVEQRIQLTPREQEEIMRICSISKPMSSQRLNMAVMFAFIVGAIYIMHLRSKNADRREFE